jgi:drug/metabolite transporter (DMT)-like permease
LFCILASGILPQERTGNKRVEAAMSKVESPSSSMSGLQWGWLVGLSVLWGGSFFFNKIAVAELPPLTIAAARVTIAALALWAAMAATRTAAPGAPRVWGAFAVLAILNNVIPFSLILWAQARLPSGVASILNAMTPIFTVLAAHVLTSDEKLTPGRAVGVALGFGGVVALAGPAATAGLSADLLPQLACLGAALSYAFAGIYGRRFRAIGLPSIAVAAGQLTMAAVLLIPLACLFETPWTLAAPSAKAAGAVVAVALASTALGYLVFFKLLASGGATNVALVTFLIPVSAILLGVGLLGERLEPRHFIGMALIGAGLAAIDGRLWRKLTHRA